MVYSRASGAVVRLEEENQSSDAAMDFLASIDEDFDLRMLERESALPMQAAVWTAVFALSRRRWWNRVWIIQETAVGTMRPLLGTWQEIVLLVKV